MNSHSIFAPGQAPDLDRLRSTPVVAGDPRQSFGRKKELDDHLGMIAREFSGRSELEYYHCGLIVLIRRRIKPKENFRKFHDLWEKEADFLLERLDSRWLISACDTFADHATRHGERAAALAGTLFMNTVKLYETERLASGAQDTTYAPIDGLQPLFDGISAFTIGKGDMVRNLLERVASPFPPELISPRIVRELVGRAMKHDTVFRRFASVHANPATRW